MFEVFAVICTLATPYECVTAEGLAPTCEDGYAAILEQTREHEVDVVHFKCEPAGEDT